MEENNKAVEASKTEEKQTKLDETEYLIAGSGTAPAGSVMVPQEEDTNIPDSLLPDDARNLA